MRASGYPPFLSLGHRLSFFIVVFGFLQLIFLAEKCFKFQFYFVATYIKNNFTKSVFVTFVRCRQHVSRDQTVLANENQWRSNEPRHHVADRKCRYVSSVFM